MKHILGQIPLSQNGQKITHQVGSKMVDQDTQVSPVSRVELYQNLLLPHDQGGTGLIRLFRAGHCILASYLRRSLAECSRILSGFVW